MNSEPTALAVGRIDEVLDGRFGPAAEAEILPLVEAEGIAGLLDIDASQSGDGVALEAGAIQDMSRPHVLERSSLAHGDPPAAGRGLEPDDLGVEEERGVLLPRPSGQVAHEVVGADDARRRRPEGGDAPHARLHHGDLGLCHEHEIVETVAAAVRRQGFEVPDLPLFGGHDKLPRAPVGEDADGAEVVEEALAFHAQPRLEGSRGVVDPGVDDLAVAAARFLADSGVPLDDADVAARAGELGGDGEADDSGPDDGDFEIMAHDVQP
jgi:hypothetical protein